MVYLRVMNYRDSKAIYAVLVSADMKDAGQPFRVITTKPDVDVPPFYSAIKLEDKELAEILIKPEIMLPTSELSYAGFTSLYLVSFDEKKLLEYDPVGAVEYSERIKTMKGSEKRVRT